MAGAYGIGCLRGNVPLAHGSGPTSSRQALGGGCSGDGADAIAHGCTAKGNDQVRFEVAIRSLAPQLKIIAPLREWELTTRDAEVLYAQERNIPLPITLEKPFSIDQNLWGCAIECGEMEELWNEPPEDAWRMTKDPSHAPRGSIELVLGFEQGIPVSIDGRSMGGVELIEYLNELAGKLWCWPYRHG